MRRAGGESASSYSALQFQNRVATWRVLTQLNKLELFVHHKGQFESALMYRCCIGLMSGTIMTPRQLCNLCGGLELHTATSRTANTVHCSLALLC